MASSAGNDNEYRELTQFEIRRADLVGQIGDVSHAIQDKLVGGRN